MKAKKNHRLNIKRVASVLMICCILSMLFATAVFATDGTAETISGSITSGMEKVYSIITAIVVPVAIICAAVAAFQIFLGGEKGMEKAKRIIIYTLLGVAIVYLAPLIVREVGSWFKGYSNFSNLE